MWMSFNTGATQDGLAVTCGGEPILRQMDGASNYNKTILVCNNGSMYDVHIWHVGPYKHNIDSVVKSVIELICRLCYGQLLK